MSDIDDQLDAIIGEYDTEGDHIADFAKWMRRFDAPVMLELVTKAKIIEHVVAALIQEPEEQRFGLLRLLVGSLADHGSHGDGDIFADLCLIVDERRL